MARVRDGEAINQEWLKLTFEELDGVLDDVPYNLVIQTLNGIARIVSLLLGTFENAPNTTLGSNAELKKQFERRFQLRLGQTEKGSYAIPVRLVSIDDSIQKDFFAVDGSAERALQEFRTHFDAAFMSTADPKAFIELFPNASNAQRVAKGIASILPKREFKLQMTSTGNRNGPILDSTRDRESLAHIVKTTAEQLSSPVRKSTTERLSVVAEILELDIIKRTFKACTRQGLPIKGDMDQDLTDAKITFSPQIIELSGEFEVDEDNTIRSVERVHGSARVNISPIEITEIQVKNERLKAEPPLHYIVRFHHEDLFYSLHGDFDIDLWAISREELEDQLDETIKDYWLEFANEEDSKLNSGAQKLKRDLLARLQRI